MNRSAPLLSGSLVGVLSVFSLASAESTQAPFQVRVAAEIRNGNPILVFSVANESKRPITINESALPWGNRYSVMIVAVPERKGPLEGVFPIEDVFVEKPVLLRPGTRQTGEVHLNWHVRNPQAELHDRDLIVFWHYEPHASDETSLGEYGGWLTLKATAPSK